MKIIMKQLLLLNIILAALSAPAHAATIQAFATDVKATSGSFSATVGGPALSTDADIQTILTSNADTYLSGYYPSDYLYGFSASTYSEIDLGFGDTTVKTGSGGDTKGADLVVVSLWNDSDYEFMLEAFDTAGSSLSLYTYTVDSSTPNALDGTGAILNDVKTTSINLYNSNYAAPTELDDNIEIGYIRLTIGGGLNLEGDSNFSLVGAYHTDATVVPLPLPAILFSSGLLLLGWVGRRKAV